MFFLHTFILPTEPNGSLLCQCLAGIGSVSKDLLPQAVIPELLSVLETSIKSTEEPTQFEVSFT